MPEKPTRDNKNAAAAAPKSPEEMMQSLLQPAADDNLPPPEDYAAPDMQRFARPEDIAPPPAEENRPPPAAESVLPDPRMQALRAAAQPFLDMQNQAATLADLLQKEEISFDEYRRLLYEAMIQDAQGHWWMIDAENDDWYRHSPANNQWETAYPAALRALEEAGDAASDPEATVTQADSAYDLPPSYGSPGAAIYDERGVKIGTIPPTKDEHYTVPGAAAFADELPGQQPTVTAEAQPAGTVYAPPAAEAEAVIPRAIDSDFDLGPAPLVKQTLAQRRSGRLRLAFIALIILLIIALIAGIGATFAIMLWYRDRVEPFAADIAALEHYAPAYQTARIFDTVGNLLATLNSRESGSRTAIPLERVSPYMIHAIVSQENERYFEDPGFDPIAIVRAFIQNLSASDTVSGASTITQQIARSLVLPDYAERHERKVYEILVALEIANRYDKKFILELYLNEIFFANQNYGVEAAANYYFGQSAAELNFAEAALLTSIVPSPLQNDPVPPENRAAAMTRLRATMGKMLAVGCLQFQHGDWLSQGPFCIDEASEVVFNGENAPLVILDDAGTISGGVAILQIAEIETTDFQPQETRLRYPHFVDYVRAALLEELGEAALFRRGLNVYTTLNPALQDAAQAALSAQVRALAASGVDAGAVMVSDPNSGAIRAMVGGHDFYGAPAGQVNNALSYQQPGSAIKPFVVLTALKNDNGAYLTPASIIWDVPLVEDLGAGGIYEPQNIDGEFHGPVSLRETLQNSYNVATVKVFRDNVGIGRFANTIDAVGLHFPQDSLLSLSSALGANEVRLYDMMSAYGIFANGGQHRPLYAIERITETIDGEEREIARERLGPTQAISPALAYLMQNILSDDSARSPSFQPDSNLTLARLGIPTQNSVGAKTGTSNSARDLWTMGFTRNAVVGVWLGTSDNSPTYGTSGINSAAPVWNAVMAAATQWQPPLPFENPGGVVAREICRSTGTLSFSTCPDPTTDLFLQEQYAPPPEQAFLQRVQVDSWTLLRANEFCTGHVIEQNFAAINDAATLEWLNSSEAGQAYAEGLGLTIPVKPPPQAGCAQGQELPLVNISSPNQGATLRGAVELRGQVQAPDFDKFELLYATVEKPTEFYPISAGMVQMPAYGSPLVTWDTVAAQVPNGDYILRLAATSLSGGFINFDLNITVDNSAAPPAEPVSGPTVENIITPTPAGG